MNQEIRFRITADTQDVDKSINQIIKNANMASVEMDNFVAILENASTVQLENITENLLNEIEVSNQRLSELQAKLLDILSQEDVDVEAFGSLKKEIEEVSQHIIDADNKLKLLGASTAPEQLEKKFNKLSLKTTVLGKEMSRLGRRIKMALAMVVFAMFRKRLSEAIEMVDGATAKFDAMAMGIASGLVPVMEILVNKIQKAFVWVAKLIYLLTGFNIIEKAISQTSKKINGIGSSVKKANKQINNMLGGLDEITNITPETQDVGGISIGNVDTSGLTASMEELENMKKMFEDIDISWAKKLGKFLQNNKEILKKIGVLMLTAWTLNKIGLLQPMLKGLWNGFVKLYSKIILSDNGIKGWIKSLTNTQKSIGLTMIGLSSLIASFARISKSWDTMSTGAKIFEGALLLVGGAMLAVGAKSLIMGTSIATAISIATLGIGALIGAVVGAVAVFVNWYKEVTSLNKEIKNTEEATLSLEEATQNYQDTLLSHTNAVDDYEDKLKALQQAEKKTGLSGEALARQVSNGTLTYQNMNKEQREVYKKYLEMTQAQTDLDTSTKDLSNAFQAQTKAEFDLRLSTAQTAEEMYSYRDAVVKAMEDGSLSAEDGKTALEKAMAGMSTSAQQTFMKDIPENIKEGLEPNKYATAWKRFNDGFMKHLNELNSNMTFWSDKVSKKLGEIGTKAGNFISSGLKKGFQGAIKGIYGIINGAISGINLLIKGINYIPGVYILPITKLTVPSFDVGTDYVPKDMLAMVHQGEKIVPKKYNNDDFGKSDMTETNSLLRELLCIVRDKNLTIDGKVIGETAVNYIKSETRGKGVAII